MAASGYKVFTTGDVLTAADVNNYLMLQTVMVFANAAARTTALSSVLAAGLVSYLKDTNVVEIYTGSGWVSLDDPNAVQNASYYAAGKNGIINGAMNVWQRGTTFAISNTQAYTADRFQGRVIGACTTSFSRQTTSDTTNLPFIQYCMRVQRASGQTATPSLVLENSFESAATVPFVGKTVTMSFYARAGSNFSGASNQIVANLVSGTGTDQNIASYTGTAFVINSSATLTTTWQRFTYTGTVATTATEMGTQFYYTAVGTAGTNDYFEVTGVQVEIGASATSFQTASGTIGGELALCQRYYFRASVGTIGNAIATSTTAFEGNIPLPVAMRITPATLDSSTTRLSDGVTITNTATLLLNASNSNLTSAYLTGTVASGLTQYRPYFFSANAGYYGFSAEL